MANRNVRNKMPMEKKKDKAVKCKMMLEKQGSAFWSTGL